MSSKRREAEGVGRRRKADQLQFCFVFVFVLGLTVHEAGRRGEGATVPDLEQPTVYKPTQAAFAPETVFFTVVICTVF